MVWSFPRPTFSPGCHFVPRCLKMIWPGITYSSVRNHIISLQLMRFLETPQLFAWEGLSKLTAPLLSTKTSPSTVFRSVNGTLLLVLGVAHEYERRVGG